MANPLMLAAVVALGLLLLHVWQVPLLSGSLREFWTRNNANAQISKALFGLSFCACLLIVFVPPFGIRSVQGIF